MLLVHVNTDRLCPKGQCIKKKHYCISTGEKASFSTILQQVHFHQTSFDMIVAPYCFNVADSLAKFVQVRKQKIPYFKLWINETNILS